MKAIKWLNGNKMLFESQHKTFNRQTDIISTGNILANTQRGSFIRAFTEIECNGSKFPKGHLREFDFDGFFLLPTYIKKEVERLTETQTGILYEFFYYSNNKKVVLGYVFTDKEHNLVKNWNVSGSFKAESALNECIKYVSNTEQIFNNFKETKTEMV